MNRTSVSLFFDLLGHSIATAFFFLGGLLMFWKVLSEPLSWWTLLNGIVWLLCFDRVNYHRKGFQRRLRDS